MNTNRHPAMQSIPSIATGNTPAPGRSQPDLVGLFDSVFDITASTRIKLVELENLIDRISNRRNGPIEQVSNSGCAPAPYTVEEKIIQLQADSSKNLSTLQEIVNFLETKV